MKLKLPKFTKGGVVPVTNLPSDAEVERLKEIWRKSPVGFEDVADIFINSPSREQHLLNLLSGTGWYSPSPFRTSQMKDDDYNNSKVKL